MTPLRLEIFLRPQIALSGPCNIYLSLANNMVVFACLLIGLLGPMLNLQEFLFGTGCHAKAGAKAQGSSR